MNSMARCELPFSVVIRPTARNGVGWRFCRVRNPAGEAAAPGALVTPHTTTGQVLDDGETPLAVDWATSH